MDFQNQKLFDYMANEHGVTLLESELGDLIRVVNEESPCSPSTGNSELSLRDGHLPDFEGKPVLASCTHCAHCTDASDGWEYGPPWYVCDKKPHMSNLKGFPFKTAQKCCDLHIAFTADWSAIAREEGYT